MVLNFQTMLEAEEIRLFPINIHSMNNFFNRKTKRSRHLAVLTVDSVVDFCVGADTVLTLKPHLQAISLMI